MLYEVITRFEEESPAADSELEDELEDEFGDELNFGVSRGFEISQRMNLV